MVYTKEISFGLITQTKFCHMDIAILYRYRILREKSRIKHGILVVCQLWRFLSLKCLMPV